MALTLCVFIFGLYNITMVIRTRRKFANELLLLFYVFSEVTLLMRFALYIYVIVANHTSSPCKMRGLAITLQDLPDYLYLMSGMCQLFIILQIVMSFQVRKAVEGNEDQDVER